MALYKKIFHLSILKWILQLENNHRNKKNIRHIFSILLDKVMVKNIN